MKTKQIGEEKPNNNWEIEFDNRDLGCCGGDSCPHYVVRQDENGNNVGTNHNEVLKDFISKLLKTQREEIVSEIEGILGEDEEIRDYMDGYLHIECDKQSRNQFRNEIRERLKQITNLKEK